MTSELDEAITLLKKVKGVMMAHDHRRKKVVDALDKLTHFQKQIDERLQLQVKGECNLFQVFYEHADECAACGPKLSRTIMLTADHIVKHGTNLPKRAS